MQVVSGSAPAFPRLLLPAFMLAAAGAGLVVVRVQSAVPMGTELVLAAMVGLLSLGPLLVRAWQGRFDLFEPLTLISVIFFLFYSVGPLVHIATGKVYFGGRDFTRLYAQGLLLVSIPILATWCGYALPLGRVLGERFAAPLRLTRPGLRVLRRWGWWVTALAVVGAFLWLQVSNHSIARLLLPGIAFGGAAVGGGGEDVPWFLLALEWLVPAFLLLVAARGFPNRAVLWAYWLAVMVVYSSLAFRSRILVFVVACATLFYLRRNRRPNPLLVGVTAGVLFMAAGWYAQARLFIRSYGRFGSLELSPVAALESGLADTRIFETFLTLTQVVPHYIDYVYTDPFVYPLVLPFPRALWPEKPSPDWLPLIAESFGTPDSMTYGLAVPNFGEYYMAFGWTGVVVGMLFFGIMARALWSWYRTDPDDPARQAVFAVSNIWLLMFMSRGYLSQMVREWCFFILPALLVWWMARRAERIAALEARA